jgi:hypothetical protein
MTGDAQLVSRLAQTTQGTRAFLCALGRRGKWLFRDEPARAEALLAAVQPHPVYKAGRILFDLLELEDLMLDGPAPASEPEGEAKAIQALLAGIERFNAVLGGGVAQPAEAVAPVLSGTSSPPPGGWPELSSADYLFDLVVMGLLSQASQAQV